MGGRFGRWASARGEISPSRRQWAASLFAEALPSVKQFHSPRAWAFTLLGLDAYCAVVTDDYQCPAHPASAGGSADVHPVSGGNQGLGVVRGGLAYDNARLPRP